MCHPTTGDLLRRGVDRLLPGIRIWGGLCAGGNVLDLYGRLPGRRAGRRASLRPITIAADSGPFVGSGLQGTRKSLVSKQQQGALRVVTKRSAYAAQPVLPCRTRHAMPSSLLFLATDERRHMARDTRRAGQDPMGLAVDTQGQVRRPGIAPSSSQAAGGRIDAQFGRLLFPQDFRRSLRSIADAEQISTGASRTNTDQGVHQTSVIVLVTLSGTVPVCSNDTPERLIPDAQATAQ